MLIIENKINVVSEEELENDSKEVFKEDKETVDASLGKLRSWILSQAHMRNVRYDESILRLFLRGCNYDLAKAQDKLDLYFSARKHICQGINQFHSIKIIIFFIL